MAHERLPVLSSFAHRMTTLRAVLLADPVLLVFFVGRVLVREVGGTFVLPAAAVAGLVLVALENRTVARGVRQALFSPENFHHGAKIEYARHSSCVNVPNLCFFGDAFYYLNGFLGCCLII